MQDFVLITGASGGIGLEFARIFAKNKENLFLVARNEEKLREVKEELEKEGVQVHILSADLTKKEEVEKVCAYAADNDLNVTTLVNNAGFGDFGEFISCDYSKQRDMIDLNIMALMTLTHSFLPVIKESGRGRILFVASIAAFQAGPLMSVYYASKAFVLSFSEALHTELKKSGVKVTALCPGPISTNFEKAANLSNSGLFKVTKVATADKVAGYGYKKLNKNKAVAIYGFRYKLLVFLSRFAPRSLVRRVVYKIMKVR